MKNVTRLLDRTDPSNRTLHFAAGRRRRRCLGVFVCLMWLAGTVAHAAEPGVFDDAVAVWHLRDLHDVAGADSSLTVSGSVRLDVPLEAAEREASVARGGDGVVAAAEGGSLVAGQGAAGELALSGRCLSLHCRLRNPSGQWNSCGIVSKYGGHQRLVYNLYSHAGDLGFELGTADGLFRVTAPLTEFAAAAWHDVTVRYDGRRLQLFVDGVCMADAAASGELRRENAEPLVVAGYSVDGRVQGPFVGLLDTVAVWKRGLTDDEIIALGGGVTTVRENRATWERKRDAGLPTEVAAFRRVMQGRDRAEYARTALALRRWMIAHDPHYPKYHFVGPESWINDPNGPIYYRDKYHLFYQYSPIVSGRRSDMCWGHAVSTDLVHWQDWPVALWPDTPQDRSGVYSGNTVVADDGSLCALYTGNVAGHRETYGILARSHDEGLTWDKRVVMGDEQRPNADSPVHWDGFLWRDAGRWQQLIGGTTGGDQRQGAAWLWTSPDLEHWTRERNIAPSIKFGAYWELPYLIPLGGRHVLLVGHGNPYWVGKYDVATATFTFDQPVPRQIDTGHYYSFNLNMTDDRGPRGARRQLMHGWVTGPPTPTGAVPYWQGAHSIPRVIRLEGDRIWQEPIPEIEKLRGRRYDQSSLPQVRGDALELLATFEPGTAKRFGLKLRVSADGQEFTRVFFDTTTRQFGVDGPTPARNARELKEVRAADSQDSLLPAASPVAMHVLLDRSIVEVFVNGVGYTARTFPPPDALGVELFSEGGQAQVTSLAVYELQSSW